MQLNFIPREIDRCKDNKVKKKEKKEIAKILIGDKFFL